MRGLFSYVIFGENSRYWKLLPFIYMANRLLRPTFSMRFLFASDATATPGYRLAGRLADADHAVEVLVESAPYRELEPTLWRFRPIWEQGVDVLFSRDMDSIPTASEIRSERLFLESEFLVHGIRAHPHHSHDLLAGLCGFKVSKLTFKKGYDQKSYDEFTKLGEVYKWRRWVDQGVLRDWCVQWRASTLLTNMNGAPPCSRAHPIFGVFGELPQEAYLKVSMEDLHEGMVGICDQISLFPGAQVCPLGESGGFVDGRYGHPIGRKVDLDAALERALSIEVLCARKFRVALFGLADSFRWES